MATLPKRMLPVPLSSVKRAVYRALLSRTPPPAGAAASAGATALAPPPSPASPNTHNSTTMSFRGDVGTSVLERETVADIEAALAAPLPRAPPRRGPGHSPAPGGGDDNSDDEDDKDTEDDADAAKKTAADFESLLAGRRAVAGLKPGAWDPAVLPSPRRNRNRGDDSEDGEAGSGNNTADARRLQELSEREAYLRNFWYAAALSENVKPGVPHGVDMLGGRVVLFRDADTGRVRALDDACPHRGAPLSGGWLASARCGHGNGTAPLADARPGDATAVVCPYHGWAFDGEGKLRDVPSAEPGRWPKRPLLDSHPIEERGGFVWLFFGDARLPADERPPIPYSPELDAPGWRAVYGEIEFDCPHWPVFENAIDMAHIHYLHNDSFGNSEKPRIDGMATQRDSCFSVSAEFEIHNKPVSKLWEWTAVESVPVKAKAMLPSTSSITIKLGAGVSMVTFVSTVPINAKRAVNRFCLVRNFAGFSGFDSWARRAMFKILGEDKAMIERLQPERLRREFSLGPDAPQVAFRKLRQEWVDLGYATKDGLGATGARKGGGGGKKGCGGGGGAKQSRDARPDL
jgi:phenylpropionate dioxygenase-like ring-hydroxylating dioxygenase large terminal subunit